MQVRCCMRYVAALCYCLLAQSGGFACAAAAVGSLGVAMKWS